MQYVGKYATEDKLTAKCTKIYPNPYFDKRGALKPGYSTQFDVHHYAILALMQWGQENAHVRGELFKKHKLRFITNKTIFGYEVKTLVSMMHWDEFNKSFKFGCILGHLKKKGTSFEKLREKAVLMLKEEERLSSAKFKRGMRYGRKFHAAVRIQEWWLRKKRKFRIYKNLYQLMDEYSVEGGFTGQDSAKYLGKGKGKNLLKIQEDIMKKVEMRRIKCHEVSKTFVKNILQKKLTEHPPDNYEMIYLPPAPTHKNWLREMSPSPPSCDEGPEGDIGPASSGGGWLGRWGRRLGLTR